MIQKFIYNSSKFLIKPLIDLYIERDVKGIENIPKKGPCILAFNHPRGYDPLIIGISSNRYFHFVADESNYRNFLRGKYYNLIGCIKTGKEDFLSATREICELLEKGEAIFVFSRGKPEKPLRKSKPTLARIVFEILKNEDIEVPVIPGNIRYEKGICYINFHEQINPKNYFENYKKERNNPVIELTNKIDEMIDLF